MKKKSLAILLVRSSKKYREEISKMLEKLKTEGYEVVICQYQTMVATDTSLIYHNSGESDIDIQDYIVNEGPESNSRQSLQATFYVPGEDYCAEELVHLYRWLDTVYIKTPGDIVQVVTHTCITRRVFIVD